MSKLQPVRGTHDLLFDEYAKFNAITNIARKIAASYGFREWQTPIFEFTDVFARTIGETSDVVTKEMYTFQDRGGENLTLRPEFTAGIVRSFISNGLQRELPLKIFTTGPVFRYERPQKGRQRQFHQLDAEWLGAQGWESDVEVILMAAKLLKELGINAELQLNSLGCKESRDNYRTKLVEYFSKFEAELSEDSKTRLHKNPMRILDSKDENDKKICENAPKLADSLSAASKENFDKVVNFLTANGQRSTVNGSLVRGLDYYNDIVFEFVSGDLGAQNTVLAGGRYDGLVTQMGGPATPAIGWGAGLERLMLLANIEAKKPEITVVIAGEDLIKPLALQLAEKLRSQGKIVELAKQTNIGKALNFANKIGAVEAYILGESEVAKNVVQHKNLVTGEQKEVSL